LDAALIVNPYDIDACAETIRVALEMNLAERRARHAALVAKIEKHDVDHWCRAFLSALNHAAMSKTSIWQRSSKPILDALEELQSSMPDKTGMQPTAEMVRARTGHTLISGRTGHATEIVGVPETSTGLFAARDMGRK
jgi:hypothetical protein